MNTVFVKIGGSFITYKEKPVSLNYNALHALKTIFQRALRREDLAIVAGNGGGSFAHYVVFKYINAHNVLLLAKCHEATRTLNRIIVDYLVENGISATSVQTSAIIHYDENKGEFEVFYKPIETLLENSIIPVVYGECLPARNKPLIVSTEKVFELLAKHVRPSRIVLLTDVGGIYTCNPRECTNAELIREITPGNVDEVLKLLKGHEKADATGGVYGKVKSMSELSKTLKVEVMIVSGFDVESAVLAILGGYPERSTLIALK